MLFTPAKDGKITVAQVLVPIGLVAFVIFIMLAFQTSQVMRERQALHQSLAAQDKPLEDAQKVQAQLNALAIGTKKLADKGDKNAEAIVARMKQLGITINDKGPAPTAATTAVPAASGAPTKMVAPGTHPAPADDESKD